MKLKITWVNPNIDATEIRVYRSDRPIEIANLPEPYAIIQGYTEEYIDENATRGNVYYYRLGSVKGDDEILTDNINVKAVTFTGPGPQEIIAGDWELGFFGEIPQDDFITCNQLCTWAGFNPSRANAYGAWFKVAYKGKVLYISRSGIARYGVSYNELYNAGLVYGTDDNGLVIPPGLTGVNQRKVINASGHDLIVRLPTGLSLDHTELPTLSGSDGLLVSDPGSSEWDDIIRHFINHPFFEGDDRVPLFGNWWGLLVTVAGSNSQASTGAICQQVPSMPDIVFARGMMKGASSNSSASAYPKNSVQRFSPGGIYQINPQLAHRLAVGVSFLNTIYNTSSNVYQTWRPVLEYVE